MDHSRCVLMSTIMTVGFGKRIMGDVDPSLSQVDFRTLSPSRSSLSLPHQVHSRLPFTVGGSPCPVEGMPHTVYSRTHGEVGHEQISSTIQRHSPFDPIQPQPPATIDFTFTCYCIQSTIDFNFSLGHQIPPSTLIEQPLET
jgi:hypothetical protein